MGTMAMKTIKTQTRRDLTIVSGIESKALVIACDSCGAIVLKEGDVFKLSPRYTAKFTARVALTEVMCSGAVPVTIINGVACELNPTGLETIKGIQEEMQNAGVNDIVLTGSTEENFPTSMTALAITVIGVIDENELKFGQAESGDKFILLNRPKVGTEVDLESTGFYAEIRHLLSLPGVREMAAVGSKGIEYEVKTLASLNEKAFELYNSGIDYHKSAGPATCLLVLCAGTLVNHILEIYPAGTVIGAIQ
jgi:hypothetical protein